MKMSIIVWPWERACGWRRCRGAICVGFTNIVGVNAGVKLRYISKNKPSKFEGTEKVNYILIAIKRSRK